LSAAQVGLSRAAKRTIDLVLGSAVALLVAPLALVLGLVLRRASPGPILYRALRAGKGGHPFVMYKFRTMAVTPTVGSRITASDDARVFPLGRFLRRYKLDEIPQLLNVIRGDMSLVGPRPEDLSIVRDHYAAWMMETLAVRPGLTGVGSLYGTEVGDSVLGVERPEADYLEHVLPLKLALELDYVRTMSVRKDIEIISRTVSMFLRRGAPLGRAPEIARARLHLAELTDRSTRKGHT
jgi:lipopolysaccharide/colanic/teichoic acid biosynthesis glycosyltransferase